MNSEHFIFFVKVFNAFDWAKDNAPESVTSIYGSTGKVTGDNGARFRNNISYGISNAKIFEVDDGIKKLLCLTDTPLNNDEIRLPFERVFVDVDFSREELSEMGIEINAKRIIGILAGEGQLISEKGTIIGKDLNICILSEQDDGTFWFDDYNKNFNIGEEYKYGRIKVDECRTTDSKARDFTHKFFLNFLNFLNNPEVEYVEHKRSEKNQERRKKQGKAIIPSTMTIIVYGKLKEYIDEAMRGESFTYGYRFWVRGHFRQLQSDRYVEKKRIWVLPYIKGKGVLIEKSYQLQKKPIQQEYNTHKDL